MSYAHVQDVAASWERYADIAVELLDPPPEGLVVHVAGPTEAGFRTIAIWESEAAWCRFRDERLEPAISVLGGSARPQPTLRVLRVQHTVVGDRLGVLDGADGFDVNVLQYRGGRE